MDLPSYHHFYISCGHLGSKTYQHPASLCWLQNNWTTRRMQRILRPWMSCPWISISFSLCNLSVWFILIGVLCNAIWGIVFVLKWLLLLRSLLLFYWSLLGVVGVLNYDTIRRCLCVSPSTAGWRPYITANESERKGQTSLRTSQAPVSCDADTDNNVDVADCAAFPRRFALTRNQVRLGVRLPSCMPLFLRHYQVQQRDTRVAAGDGPQR